MSTLILSRSDVARAMATADYLEAVALGFAAAANGSAFAPPPLSLDGSGGAFHAKAARMQLDRLYVALKFNGNFPANPDLRGLPTIQGAILLCDGETGALLAIIDSIEVTLRRTAAATALAARYLARGGARNVLICGCGEQGLAQLTALRDVLPLTRCRAWDRDPARAQALAAAARALGLEAETAVDLAPAALDSDVIVTCTTAREPFLGRGLVGPGTFVAAVGADSPDKSEIEPALMREATVVADVRAQCAVMGDLHHALRAHAMRLEDVHAELADLVAGARPGRTREDEITLFDSTGTASQDVATAALLYQRVRGSRGSHGVELAA